MTFIQSNFYLTCLFINIYIKKNFSPFCIGVGQLQDNKFTLCIFLFFSNFFYPTPYISHFLCFFHIVLQFSTFITLYQTLHTKCTLFLYILWTKKAWLKFTLNFIGMYRASHIILDYQQFLTLKYAHNTQKIQHFLPTKFSISLIKFFEIIYSC